MRVVVLCLVVCLLSVFPAFGMPVTFDFSGVGSANIYHYELPYFQNGLSLTVRAYLVDELFSVEDIEEVTQTSSGLGVYTSGTDSGQLDDSFYKKELLTFSFSEAVSLRELSFVYGDEDDQFSLLVDGVFSLVSSVVENWAASEILQGEIFGLSIVDSSDDYRIQSLTVDLLPVPTPEPSTWLLLSFGVTALFWQRKRQTG